MYRTIEETLLLRKIEEVYEKIKLGDRSRVINFAMLIERWVDDYGHLMTRLSVDETINFNSLENYYLRNFPHSEGGPVLQALVRKGKDYAKQYLKAQG